MVMALLPSTTSAGPEEQVPGQVLDTVDIKVFERSTGGSEPYNLANYIGDGATVTYSIGTGSIVEDSLFVKVGANIVRNLPINYNTNEITFATAPAVGERINIQL